MPEISASFSHTFKKPWEQVCWGYINKYPHPNLSHVHSVLTLERYVNSEGQLITSRILQTSFLKIGSVWAFERSTIDPKTKTIELKTFNLNWRHLAKSIETCKYTETPTGHTLYELSCTAKGLVLFKNKLTNTVSENFQKGIKTLEEIIKAKYEGSG
jgi:PRELI-like family